ncbi:hypothetical protein NDU88_006726 [Pleurodeles waltl]|uniref:Uncharacterized protein n=1 Tax=Pleurodeles waltl TaxID=8319 RepID=A0AAV7RPS1_PLEWA|nr:hypothetical protein NDU88_006726 [Pleurodeles waltl]
MTTDIRRVDKHSNALADRDDVKWPGDHLIVLKEVSNHQGGAHVWGGTVNDKEDAATKPTEQACQEEVDESRSDTETRRGGRIPGSSKKIQRNEESNALK